MSLITFILLVNEKKRNYYEFNRVDITILFSGNLLFIIYVKHCENSFAYYQQNLLKQCLKQLWKMRGFKGTWQ
jgi:hypothetical protein